METLLVLPHRVADAAENMARDWLLLDSFAGSDFPRLRTYGWSKPAWTFGYSQRWQQVRETVGADVELVRRSTGGGVVDHRADWTYALVLPATHPWARAKAAESYRAVHQALAEALKIFGVPVSLMASAQKVGTPLRGVRSDGLQLVPDGRLGEASLPRNEAGKFSLQHPSTASSVCFTQPELHDVVRMDNGNKIAGAAQKRTRKGLLLQGSISRAAAPEVRDWDAVASVFANTLSHLLKDKPQPWSGESVNPSLLVEAQARFASTAWNERR